MMKSRRYSFIGTLLLGLVCASASGCAAMKATQQPPKRDMAVLNQGVPRTHVIAELGAPVWSDHYHNGYTVDVFSFKQGYKKSTKAARALVHGAADVVTVGLWEVVGIPAETMIDGTDVQLEVHYGPQQTVERVVVIKGEKAVNPPKPPFSFASAPEKPNAIVVQSPAAPPPAAPPQVMPPPVAQSVPGAIMASDVQPIR